MGRFLYKIGRLRRYHEHFTEKKIFRNLYTKYPFFYFFIVKITPYLSAPSLMSVGIKKMNFFNFLMYSALVSLIVKTVYVGMGYLGSVSISQLERFLDGRKMGMIYILGGIILFLSIKRCYKKTSSMITKKIKKKTEE